MLSLTRYDKIATMAESVRGSAATVPFHPALGFKFPKREYGRSKKGLRACQASWFQEFPFLDYTTAEDSVYCHVCVRAVTEKRIISAKKPDAAFLSNGFCNWKDAKVAFKKHKDSAHHREAVESSFLTSITYQTGQKTRKCS